MYNTDDLARLFLESKSNGGFVSKHTNLFCDLVNDIIYSLQMS